MASMIYHAYKQIKKTGAVKLFRSHNPDFKDGEQMRDFVSSHKFVQLFKIDVHVVICLHDIGHIFPKQKYAKNT